KNLEEAHNPGKHVMFGEAGKIRNICIHDPHTVEESKGVNKAEILTSSKLYALVEYDTVEAAEKAVATLNDEQDWRNGMRVKLLKLMVKYGKSRKVWTASDSEKNSISRAFDQTGGEHKENSSLIEHHKDIPDGEHDGDHVSKEKNGQRPRNRGQPRRQRYCGTNTRQGHGTTSAHAMEPSKPPPGPRMPDGTRGFTMGRGRPPISNQN
ncbi:RRM_5 domain-containing protein, partial [Cephalotus follicularis]